MCGCPAHHDYVDCTCQCDHTTDRLRQLRQKVRDLEAERARWQAEALREAADYLFWDWDDDVATSTLLDEVERLRAERDSLRWWLEGSNAKTERDRLSATVERVRALADRLDRHTEVESEAVEACDPDGSWYDVSDAIRAAIEGTDS